MKEYEKQNIENMHPQRVIFVRQETKLFLAC